MGKALTCPSCDRMAVVGTRSFVEQPCSAEDSRRIAVATALALPGPCWGCLELSS